MEWLAQNCMWLALAGGAMGLMHRGVAQPDASGDVPTPVPARRRHGCC
jgi:hypothetical protein